MNGLEVQIVLKMLLSLFGVPESDSWLLAPDSQLSADAVPGRHLWLDPALAVVADRSDLSLPLEFRHTDTHFLKM